MNDFTNELEFERCLINKLVNDCGWKGGVLHSPTEKELLQNWADILFRNNREIDRLNDYPLTDGEMSQIIEQIKILKTPLKLNGFINGKTISIRRDNPDDKLHFGKEVSLKIYDRQEIAGGDSLYQIAEQPIFKTSSDMLPDRRGDVLLLINGMPVIHIELKRSGVPVIQACNQLAKYSAEGVFTGILSLVQIFVAMNPNETVYFANPGQEGKFNPDFYFHWADFNNEPINDWRRIASSLLSIPMAHQLIGFYTVADNTDGILKVMRSYQYYAAAAIADRVIVANKDHFSKDNRGGYIWHTTGSGKTMTSFKSAQLIASSKDADKVIFLVDRIELGTQSFNEYKGFADDNTSVQQTESTGVLISKLKSTDPADVLIVTSIQKMSRIKEDGLNDKDLNLISEKRIVFIVDECHRNTFGEMMHTIKDTFSNAIFFGFTGTPIFEENTKKHSFTSDVFGNELHRYSIADGIRDKNVLGFDPTMVMTFKDKDLRRAVALEMSKAKSVKEAIEDPAKARIYYHFMNDVPMTSYTNEQGKIENGIEDYIPKSQYQTPKHKNAVIDDILDNWESVSYGGMFHAIFATSSINEAIEYYRMFKERNSGLHISALFDPSIDNNEGAIFKEDGLVEIIEDYNALFNQKFLIPTFPLMKKDISNRLSHKKAYQGIANNKSEQLDILIVVDQMLTGFDSKWVNALYLDKELRYEGLIQAFSRTNRLFDPVKKPFGTIRYYRRPHTMAKNIEEAVKLYSGDKPLELFVPKLKANLLNLNEVFNSISDVFISDGISDFSRVPESDEARRKFAMLFRKLNSVLEAAKIQGFSWKELTYSFADNEEPESVTITMDENTYLILCLRYKELYRETITNSFDVPYELQSYLTEINTGKIDADYMNSRFEKYLKELSAGNHDSLEKALNELHKSFSSLSMEDQKYANLFLHDVQRGDVKPDGNKTFRDYIHEYKQGEKSQHVKKFASYLGCDEDMLRTMIELGLSEKNINEYGRFEKLKATIDIDKVKETLEKKEGHPLKKKDVYVNTSEALRLFIISGGKEIPYDYMDETEEIIE